MKFLLITVFSLLASTAVARDTIQIAGSSTVLPFATIVAEAFGENSEFNTPIVEGGGTGAGIKKFCEGTDDSSIDIVTASRPIKKEELASCASAGVTDISEVRIGYDGIVFASINTGPAYALTAKDIYLAIGKDSTAVTWSDINPQLPEEKILMLVPGTKHGTREVFEQKVMIAGCKAVKGDISKDEEKLCVELRKNSVVEIDGDYTETLTRIKTDMHAIGVFGLSFYENNIDTLKVASIDNIAPSAETIATGDYPISRPLFFYVKNAHIGSTPGLKEFAQFFVSDDMVGPDGLLVEYGLVTDPKLADTQTALQ